MDTTHSSCRMGWAEWFGLAMLLGLLGGALFGAFDALYHGPDLGPCDVLVAMLFGAVPAGVFLPVLAVVVMVVLACGGGRPDRQQGVALLSGIFVIGLVGTLVLVATKNHRDWTGLLVVMASLPAAAGAYLVLGNLPVMRKPGRALVCTLAAMHALLIAACGLSTVQAWELSRFFTVAPVLPKG